MSGTDHPPSTASPTPHARRALITIVAALTGVALLVTLASTGRSDRAAAAELNDPPTLEEQAQIRSLRDGRAALARLNSIAEAVAPPTTAPPAPTTTAPPPPPTTVPPAPPAPQPVAPVASGTGYNDPANPAAWDRLAQCEAGGNWAANTGNGYYGGIQFSLGSWQSVGGTGRPDQASRETQIAMGQRLWNQGGWRHWPACTSKLGYR
jgi:hypothetical protein